MKKLNELLWRCFYTMATIALASQVGIQAGLYLGRNNRILNTHELETDSEREFMRPDWLNDNFQAYYDDVEIFINDERYESGGMCYINPFGEVYINWDLDKRWSALLVGKWCMAHEVGHWIDRQNGFPSKTDEFQKAVDLAARIDRDIACFPCICDACQDGEWGGYGEIYAELFRRESIEDIPAILWDWYLPYYQ